MIREKAVIEVLERIAKAAERIAASLERAEYSATYNAVVSGVCTGICVRGLDLTAETMRQIDVFATRFAVGVHGVRHGAGE